MAADMSQTGIPFVFMRAGTSRGPYFKRSDLPVDQNTLANVLIAALGAGHPLNIDGIGGGAAVTTKVAMLSISDDEWADIDFFFAQVSVLEKNVDFKPSCGNILSGVAPAAIEMGLVQPQKDITTVKIKAVNSGARIVATVHTPHGITYEGETQIAGVPGAGSPIFLKFMDTVGGATGHFLPTGQLTDTFDGITVSCMDVAMPMVIARADAFDLTGHESADELSNNAQFMMRMEKIRLQAGLAMGLGDVSQSVVPKFALLASAKVGGSLATRYFMPWHCHPSLAVTGAQCIAACLLTPGSIAHEMCTTEYGNPARIVLEHPSGVIEVLMDYKSSDEGFVPISASVTRTARKLSDGHVYIPTSVWCSI